MTNTSVARASDDFYPRDEASSHPHIAACAFNGLFLSALVQPDWDMFHSRHASAELHGMARWVQRLGITWGLQHCYSRAYQQGDRWPASVNS